ncbi:DNA-binding protein [Shouchella miscanthi]|uniref:DNA-binding protein n=1 Tax=Shouchella miscanthi TaxID=2598861 RepID=UPI0011A0D9F6|nr:DNA-binding protein [Shouchella miscanthi]
MPNFSLSTEEVSTIVGELKKELVPIIIKEIEAERSLPPLLTRKQFMELCDIGESKCAELFNRSDFPVLRELGYPRVPTNLFFEWVNKNTNNAQEIMFSIKAM